MNDAPFDAPASISPGHVTASTPVIAVDPSKLKALAITLSLALTATLGGATTLLHYARDRDLAGIAAFFQSSESIVFFTGLVTLGSFAALAWRTIKRKSREVYLAYHNRDRIAVVTKPIDPPKPI